VEWVHSLSTCDVDFAVDSKTKKTLVVTEFMALVLIAMNDAGSAPVSMKTLIEVRALRERRECKELELPSDRRDQTARAERAGGVRRRRPTFACARFARAARQ
jgi:hypothetical protein